MGKRIYVTGPMTGLPEFNYPAFAEAEKVLREAGFDAVSPHHNGDGDTSKPWTWYMRQAIAQLITCDGVALLPGWERSRGASLEVTVAKGLHMHCHPVEFWQHPRAAEVAGA